MAEGSRRGLRSRGPADPREARFQELLGELKWPEELLDKEWMKNEAKWAEEGRRYGFKSPEEMGYGQKQSDALPKYRAYPATLNRYVKETRDGPVYQKPSNIHDGSVDWPKDSKKKKRSAAADKHFNEHPMIEAAKDIHGYAPAHIIDQYHDQPHNTIVPTAGISPEDRPRLNKERHGFEVQHKLPVTKGLRDPIAQKKRKLQYQARLAKAAAEPPAEATRRSERFKTQHQTDDQARAGTQDETEVTAAQDQSTAAAGLESTSGTAARSEGPASSAQEKTPFKPQGMEQRTDLFQEAVKARKAKALEASRLMPPPPLPPTKRKAPEDLDEERPMKKAATQDTRPKPSFTAASSVPQAETAATKKRKAEGEDVAIPAKRPRVNRACDKCRDKKTKCDGRGPCDACLKRGSDCIYSDGPAPISGSKIKSESDTSTARATSSIPTAMGAANLSASSTSTFSSKITSTKAESSKTAQSQATQSQVAQSEATQSKATQSKATQKKAAPDPKSSASTTPGRSSSKQSRACDQCRVKKTKCDGRQPCDACAKRKFLCTYGAAEAFPIVKKGTGPSGPSGPSDASGAAGPPGASGSSGHPALPDTSGPPAPGSQSHNNHARRAAGFASNLPPRAMQDQKMKLKDAGDNDKTFHGKKRVKVILRLKMNPAKLRSASGFEMLDFSDISEETQQSIQERLCLKMRDMKIWKLYKARQGLPAWDINDRLQEESFHNRPSIKLVIPDHLKGLLVDDWENVTKSGQVVELPHKKATVQKILSDYLAVEKPNREAGSTQMDILEETIDGLREYFDKALGRILLYRFERLQYAEVSKRWTPEEGPSGTYGAEHLARLLVSLPELIAQTNMDQQSVSRLREELTKFTNWLSKNYTTYWMEDYMVPDAVYIEKTKTG